MERWPMSGSIQANDEAAIRSVMSSYEGALNASDSAAVMPLYAEDGVFMAPYSQSAVGKAAVRKADDTVFEMVPVMISSSHRRPRAIAVISRRRSARSGRISPWTAPCGIRIFRNRFDGGFCQGIE
jgi:hypothetical protein